jgi:hypothetical protein
MKSRLAFFMALAGAVGVFAADSKVAPAAAPKPEAVRAAAPAAARNGAAVAPATGFDAFRTIVDRNIFNPNRTGARRDRGTEERPPRTDTLTLVGTMESEHGVQSFFDGSDPAYRKALRVGETIAEFKVTRIGANDIDVERDGKTMTVQVGQQFRRPEGSDWTLVGADAVRQEAQTQTRVLGSVRPDPTAPPVIPADADEVTRKLLERRAQSLKQ